MGLTLLQCDSVLGRGGMSSMAIPTTEVFDLSKYTGVVELLQAMMI